MVPHKSEYAGRLDGMPVEPVGIVEIAERLGVAHVTVKQWLWRTRHGNLTFPDPQWSVSGMPAWDWKTVERWARQTGRVEVPKKSAAKKVAAAKKG